MSRHRHKCPWEETVKHRPDKKLPEHTMSFKEGSHLLGRMAKGN